MFQAVNSQDKTTSALVQRIYLGTEKVVKYNMYQRLAFHPYLCTIRYLIILYYMCVCI